MLQNPADAKIGFDVKSAKMQLTTIGKRTSKLPYFGLNDHFWGILWRKSLQKFDNARILIADCRWNPSLSFANYRGRNCICPKNLIFPCLQLMVIWSELPSRGLTWRLTMHKTMSCQISIADDSVQFSLWIDAWCMIMKSMVFDDGNVVDDDDDPMHIIYVAL